MNPAAIAFIAFVLGLLVGSWIGWTSGWDWGWRTGLMEAAHKFREAARKNGVDV